MKAFVFVFILAYIASTLSYEVDEIPSFMRERLDKVVELRRKWEQKWIEMSPEQREIYEKTIYSRLGNIPESVKAKINQRMNSLSLDDRTKLRNYLYQRFPTLEAAVQKQADRNEIDVIIDELPELVREKISDFISIRFAPSAAYNSDDDADLIEFPNVPDLVEIPMPEEGVGVPYGEHQIPQHVIERLDAFLLKREEWKRRWENLPIEKREAFEKYLKERSSKV